MSILPDRSKPGDAESEQEQELIYHKAPPEHQSSVQRCHREFGSSVPKRALISDWPVVITLKGCSDSEQLTVHFRRNVFLHLSRLIRNEKASNYSINHHNNLPNAKLRRGGYQWDHISPLVFAVRTFSFQSRPKDEVKSGLT